MYQIDSREPSQGRKTQGQTKEKEGTEQNNSKRPVRTTDQSTKTYLAKCGVLAPVFEHPARSPTVDHPDPEVFPELMKPLSVFSSLIQNHCRLSLINLVRAAT